jgi:hypothetical protein
MSQIAQLASGPTTAVDVLTIELVETDEHPTVVIIGWPDKPSVIHPRRFPDTRASLCGCSPRRIRHWRNQVKAAAVTACAVTSLWSRAGRRQGRHQDSRRHCPGQPTSSRSYGGGRQTVHGHGRNIRPIRDDHRGEVSRRAAKASILSTFCVHLEVEVSGPWKSRDERLVQMTPKPSWTDRTFMSWQGSIVIATPSSEST